ncbi:MAG: beta-glucosidase [Oscillospiraceae bacterium]
MMDDKKLLEIMNSLTLREKAALCSGATSWQTKANPAKGIPSLFMADGPHGVRLEDRKNEKANKSRSKPATCFPPEVTLACSWSPELTRQVGEAIAEECRHYGVHMILGPGINMKRSPLGGRNFEYYSEDPVLTGRLAAGFINGVQSRGVATSLKHFAVNNQEEKRMSINAQVDERALFDLYLKGFELAVQNARPATVMCSYNRVNGEYASENRRLLTDILRLRFGFTGAVVSDWGAVNNRPEGVAAGLDLEMPTAGGVNDYEIVKAVENGSLLQDALDTACWNLLRLIFSYSNPAPQTGFRFETGHALAVQALAKSAVLLKNDGLLPLAEKETLAVIGEMAQIPRYQGGGSSVMNPQNLVSFTSALQQSQISFTYSPGYSGNAASPALLQQAAEAAAKAEKVVLFVGLPDAYECEGYDRTHINLPENHVELLNAVAAANPNLCVVLCCGSPVATPWLGKAKALLCLHLGGEGLGEAAVQLLFGRANPAGKLAETWPLALEDTPAFHHFPMGPAAVSYNESLYVGYRYYNTAGKAVQFPFGYGLSYTRFAYSGLTLSANTLKKDETLTASFTLTNTGGLAGEEIVQLYVSRKNSAFWHPVQELKAFARVALQPSESRVVQLEVPYGALAFYNPETKTNIVEAGLYEIQVGENSHSLPLKAEAQVEGVKPAPGGALSAGAFYGHIQGNRFPANKFEALYGSPLQQNTPVQKGGYTQTTTLGEMGESFWGRRLLQLAIFISGIEIRFSADPEVNARACRRMSEDLPFKNLVLQTKGILSPYSSSILLNMCNGKGGFWRFIASLFGRRPYRRKK